MSRIMDKDSDGTFSASTLQPKFRDCALEDKQPPGYIFTWIKIIGGIVSNLNEKSKGGWELEAFLNGYLGRTGGEEGLRPAFLEDPALQLPESASTPFGTTSSPAKSGSSDALSYSLGQSLAHTESTSADLGSEMNNASSSMKTFLSQDRDDIPDDVRQELDKICPL